MTFHWSFASWSLVAVGLADGVASTWVLRHRGAIGRVSVAMLLATAGVWCVAYGLEMAAVEPGNRELWGACKYVGSTLLPPAWMVFVLEYTGHGRRVTRRLVGLLAVEPSVVLGLLACPATRRLVRSYPPHAVGPVPEVRLGPAYWPHFVYTNGLVLYASALLVITLIRISPLYRRQSGLLLAVVTLTLTGNALASFGVGWFGWLDPTPVVGSLAGWVLVWGVFRFRLLDLLPVARTRVFERITDGVLVVDAYRRIVDLNPAARRMLGPAAAVGRPVADVLRDQAAVLDAESGVAEVRLGADPVARHVEVTVSPLGNRDDDRAGHLLLLRDISERKEVEDRLRWLANYDPLTRLPNRRLFGDRLAQAMIASRRHQARGALVLIDLDGFKLINDSLGHQVGDELLVAVADRLRQQRREQYTAARLGGDEFAVLLPEIGHAEDAAVVATKILAAVAQPVRIRGHVLNVTVSIGATGGC